MWKAVGVAAALMITAGSLVAMIRSEPDIVPPVAAALAFTAEQLDADTVLLVHRDRGPSDTIGLDSATLRRLEAYTSLDVWDYRNILECDEPAKLRGCTYLAPHPGLEITRPSFVNDAALVVAVGVTRPHSNGKSVIFESYAISLELDEAKRWQVTGFQREMR